MTEALAALARVGRPLLIVAAVVAWLVVGAELGSRLFLPVPALGGAKPGVAIPMLALVDVFLALKLTTLALDVYLPKVALPLAPVLHVVAGLLALIAGFLLALAMLVLLLLLVGLFLAVPFGTLAYMAAFGSFNRGGAAATLTGILIAKLVAYALVFAVLPNALRMPKKFLVPFALFAGVGLLVSLLHGLVPIFLVTITDALAALVLAVVGLAFGLVMLVLNLVPTVKSAGAMLRWVK